MNGRTHRRVGRIIRRAPDPTALAVREAVFTEVFRGAARRPVRRLIRIIRRNPEHDPSVIHKGGKR